MPAIPILMAVLLMGSGSERAKVKLVFSIDQGFGNGIVVNRDVEGMKRILKARDTLRPAYDVYPLFEPQVKDRASLEQMLDLCVAADMPFVLDAYSSDAMTLGTSTAHNAPADGPYGIAISMEGDKPLSPTAPHQLRQSWSPTISGPLRHRRNIETSAWSTSPSMSNRAS